MSDWVSLSLLSALGLGIYDILKKKAVHGNSAMVTLLFTTASGAFFCLLLLLWRASHQPSFEQWIADFPSPTLEEHFLIFLKASLVSSSWIFAYLSLKHLPLSIVSPIRSSSPIWTLMVAWLFFSESPTWNQFLAFSLTLGSYLWFSLLGKKDGLSFLGQPWILCILIGTWLGSLSAIYDKWLIQVRGLHPVAVQLYFSVGMVIFQSFMLLTLRRFRKEKTSFEWRWSIPFVGLTLLIADAFYFHALQNPEALVALVSALRRGSLLVAFTLSIWILREPQAKGKLWPVLGVFAGLTWLALSG